MAGDIFDYVYGVLHAPDYQKTFAFDLKKQLPRIPFVKRDDFVPFRDAGRELAKLHLGFETGAEYERLAVLVNGSAILPEVLEDVDFRVKKMRWEKGREGDSLKRITYNPQITLANIPEEALDYKVSGRSALDWVIDRYQIKTDKDSQITNDPNAWIKEQNDPQWLIKHIARITHLSLHSTRIIKSLPKAISP